MYLNCRRFLTIKEKQEICEDLKERIAINEIDETLVHHLLKINSLKEIASIDSCDKGHLSLILSKKKSKQFYDKICQLSIIKNILSVSIYFSGYRTNNYCPNKSQIREVFIINYESFSDKKIINEIYRNIISFLEKL